MRADKRMATAVLFGMTTLLGGCGSAEADPCTTMMERLVACGALQASALTSSVSNCKAELASDAACAAAIRGISSCYAKETCAALATAGACQAEADAFVRDCATTDAEGLQVHRP